VVGQGSGECVRLFDFVEVCFALDENDLGLHVQILACDLTCIVSVNLYNSFGVSSYMWRVSYFNLRAEYHVDMACIGFVSGRTCQEFYSIKCETTLKPGKLPLNRKHMRKCSIFSLWKVYRQTYRWKFILGSLLKFLYINHVCEYTLHHRVIFHISYIHVFRLLYI
jgi:hypothetical protein